MKLANAHSAEQSMNEPPRVAVALGAGGVLGGAWLAGTLHAIASETGWDPAGADYIVGTSAGSMVGALIACGVPPWFIVEHSAGETFDGLTDRGGEVDAAADGSGGAIARVDRGRFAVGPGSWRLALASLARPHRYSPMALIAGWVRPGIVSTEPLKDLVRQVCRSGWSPHPNFWPVAVDYATGRRVVFGRSGSPHAQLPDAVAASCAIPGFYRTVTIGGRSYVDGGVYSTSNLDVLRNERLDVVLALNPLSSLPRRSPRTVAERLAFAMRKQAHRRIGAEATRLRAAGIDVVLIQPTADDLDAMGSDLMSNRRRHDVVQTAVRTMTKHLHDTSLSARLAELPNGDGPRSCRSHSPQPTWLEFSAAARHRWAGARAA